MEARSVAPIALIILLENNKALQNDPETMRELAKMKQELEEGRTLVEKINAFTYLECSTKSKEQCLLDASKLLLKFYLPNAVPEEKEVSSDGDNSGADGSTGSDGSGVVFSFWKQWSPGAT